MEGKFFCIIVNHADPARIFLGMDLQSIYFDTLGENGLVHHTKFFVNFLCVARVTNVKI